jgi:SsrA-binding protein
MAIKIIATNKKAYHNFHLSQTWEAGIALSGGEVKSVREGGVSFADSFARVEKGEAFLYNLHVNPYREASYLNQLPDRSRKLLLHKKEIAKLYDLVRIKGMALVPTKIYFNARGLVKVELALGQGKKSYDKREDIKKREIDRGLKRALSTRRK